MREQIINVMDDWIHTSPQTEWAEDKEKELEPIINNETIPYLYVNYIYQGKNWKYLVYRVNNGHCGYYHYMLYRELHLKDRV